jgi:hypothetical protein
VFTRASSSWWVWCGCAVLSLVARAEPLKLPAGAITDDTFLVARAELAKAEPAVLEATAKAALEDKADVADELLGPFKEHYAQYKEKGIESAAVVMSGDPDASTRSAFYFRLKAGTDHGPIEAMIREQAGDKAMEKQEIAGDGDFVIVRPKLAEGAEAPAASEEREKLFKEAWGDGSRGAATGVVIFNDAMIAGVERDAQHGAPPGLVTIAKQSKWLRADVTLGEKPEVTVAFRGADEEGAKGLAEAVGSVRDALKVQIAAMRALGANAGAEVADMADAMSAIAEAMEAKVDGAEAVIHVDAKAMGAITRGVVRGVAQGAEANKAGL